MAIVLRDKYVKKVDRQIAAEKELILEAENKLLE
jgi:hypothetical protein